MNERTVELRGLGYWNDDVGCVFDHSATQTVRDFNNASLTIWKKINKLSQYSMDDIQYTSQRSNILQMRAEYHG